MFWIRALVVAWAISSIFTTNVFGGDRASGTTAIHDGARLVEDAGPIMYVDHAQRHIIIKEIPHVVGQFVMNEKVHTTRLVDANGNLVDLESFERGQWVMVQGYRVAKSKIYLKSVRAVIGVMPKEKRTVERLKPIE